MNPDTMNMSTRKFLKMVGINSQREIEQAVTRAIADGGLRGDETLAAKMTLSIGELNLHVDFDGQLKLE